MKDEPYNSMNLTELIRLQQEVSQHSPSWKQQPVAGRFSSGGGEHLNPVPAPTRRRRRPWGAA
ncbi:MAG: hypothetical protein HYZ53_14320 [Planctomycetes bacterium]|nr:hypothetical protein [Planctomycetota bacterium]